MVRYITLSLLLIFFMLAIISRKNYSKYKGEKNPFRCLADVIASYLPQQWKQKIAEYVRKTDTYNLSSLRKKTEDWTAELVYKSLMMIITLTFLIFLLSFTPEHRNNSQKLKRPEAGDSSSYEEIELLDKTNNKTETYELEVHSREFTEEEFHKKAEEFKADIEKEMLGKNVSGDEIQYDLVFPKKDRTGALKASWETSDPTVISSEGKVENAGIEEPREIKITANIRDENYRDTYETSLVVIKDKDISDSEKAKLEMLEIERDSRSEKELVIPEQIGDIEVKKVVESKAKKYVEVLVFGGLLIGLFTYYGFYKLRESGEKRRDKLGEQYYSLVNRMNIYIGAGLTVQNALRTIVKNKNSEYLSDEITYTLNKIASGEPEPKAYIELGKNLGTEEYSKLMSLISQNMEYGNSNLIKLMDSEVKLSFYLKKEDIRKRGEKASEKLLLPTLILMFIVMIIVMYPAFVGMG